MRTVFISGSTGNLGKAVAKRFLAAGDTVYGTLLPDEILPEDLISPEFIPVHVDLNNESASSTMINDIITRKSAIDVAILTAGGYAVGDIASTTTENLLQQFKLNVETTYNAARPIFTSMLSKNKGRIFMVGSRPGSDMHQSKGSVAYGMSKSLIFRLAELMNDEARGKDVVVNVIVPSIIDTPQNRKSMPKEDFTKWVTAEQIADIIFFHSSDQASPLKETILKTFGGS